MYDPKRLFGVTTLDVVRARTFVSEVGCPESARQSSLEQKQPRPSLDRWRHATTRVKATNLGGALGTRRRWALMLTSRPSRSSADTQAPPSCPSFRRYSPTNKLLVLSHTARRKGLLGQTGRVRARQRLTGSATVLWWGRTVLTRLLVQAEPGVKFTDEQRDAITHRIMFGGDEVVKAKAGGGSATLSMAYAGAEMADSVMAALDGKKGVTECTFVESTITPAPFFSSPVTLGKEGVETIHGYGTVNAYEQKLIDDMIPDLVAQAKKGVDWAQANKA